MDSSRPEQFLPPEGRSRETQIRRDASGRWFNGADRISHPKLVAAFNSWVDRADDGRYCLKNDINWAYVAIEGAPVFVVSSVVGPSRVELKLSDGRAEVLKPDTLRQGVDGSLYCDVRGGRFCAKFEKTAAQHLESVLAEDDEGVFLSLGGKKFRPPTVRDPLEPMARRVP